VDLPALFFLGVALFSPSFIQTMPDVKSFHWLGHYYQILESKTGPLADLTGLWFGIHIIIIFFAWFFFLGKKVKQRFAAVFGLMIFSLAAFHELFVGLDFYSGPYVLEYGFFLFSLAFFLQLFFDFFDIYRINLERSNELGRLLEESRFFLNTVSHDLKSPLLSIEGFATILQSGWKDLGEEQRQDYLKRISKNANHLTTRLTELRNFINIGIVAEEKEAFSVKEVLAEVLKSYELALKRFEVAVMVPESLPPLFSSRRRLHDIFINLLDNSIKFSQMAEHPHIKIEVSPHEEGILFVLTDNGPGIEPIHQSRVFEPFYRANPKLGGSGIGLASVKKIVLKEGGRIWLESEVGKGTKIFFILPSQKKVPFHDG
jgi:signal transduction histidine kinase